MRVLQIFVVFLTSIDCFINNVFMKNHHFHNGQTKLRMNYLESIENNSRHNRTKYYLAPRPVFLKKPISQISFDELFLRIFSIDHIYISGNCDRVIISKENTKFVYYMNFEEDKEKMEYFLSILDANITIVNDYPTMMDSPSGELYCSPNPRIASIENLKRAFEIEFPLDNINDYDDNELE